MKVNALYRTPPDLFRCPVTFRDVTLGTGKLLKMKKSGVLPKVQFQREMLVWTLLHAFFFSPATSSADHGVRRDLLPFEIPVTIPLYNPNAFFQKTFRFFRFFSASASVNQEQWVCGANPTSEVLAHASIANTCNEKMPEINMCCAMHDGCYDNMRFNQTYCDGIFCKCLDVVMTRTPGLPPSCFKFITNGFCTLVRLFGDYSYGPKKPDDPDFPAPHPAMNETVITEYGRLYASCPGYRKLLSSCAYNHMVCHLKMLPENRYDQNYEECRENLVECLHVAQFIVGKNGTETCTEQMDVVLNAVSNDAKESGIELSS